MSYSTPQKTRARGDPRSRDSRQPEAPETLIKKYSRSIPPGYTPRTRIYATTPLSPLSPPTPKAQFTSKSCVPNRWMPTYPPGFQAPPRMDALETIKPSKKVQEKPQRVVKVDIDTFQDEIRKYRLRSHSGVPEVAVYEDENAMNSTGQIISVEGSLSPEKVEYRQTRPTLAISAGSQGVQSVNTPLAEYTNQNEVPREYQYGDIQSPGESNHMLELSYEIDAVDQDLFNMKVVPTKSKNNLIRPADSPGCGVDRKFPQFPVEAHDPSFKPWVPDGYLVRNMSDIPSFLDKYRPLHVLALFDNSIVSCDRIEDDYEPIRLGRLSIFIPIDMLSGETIIVGLAPCELFHSAWQGTGSHVPPPDRSIIAKRAYEVQVDRTNLRYDYTNNRQVVYPTGNSLGTVIGIAGAACILRIEKWFLRSVYFLTHSRIVPVAGAPLPKNPKVVLYDDPKVFNEYKREMQRKALQRREEQTKLSVSGIGGVADRDVFRDKKMLHKPDACDLGPIAPPEHLSPRILWGVPEPREEPERVDWGDMGAYN
ncbi:hypothetical protein H072_535 [Dactylellina haptotyla CBS 200.50]|uniref:Uncharacterized protein n=1 Tax=Dactylellina haptotyla (strain CBS 200.50) TaxID=1284197 RepID=S8ARM6_DACHA|nr:hypothetical protein H072_535 [Dactylellina haptotyla CBS 200.50]